MRRKSLLSGIDWFTLTLYLLLIAMGWFSIYAAGFDGVHKAALDLSVNHGKQLMWIGVSLLIAMVVLIIDSKFYTTFSYPIYSAILILLLMVLVFGSTIKGSKSWITIGSFSIQPAEFAKFAANLALAKYLSSLNVNLKNIRSQIICFIIILLPVAFILLQGDVGSALVFSAFLLVLFREGLSPVYLISVVVLAILSILALLTPYLYIIAGVFIFCLISWILLRRNRQIIFIIVTCFILAAGYVYTVDFIFQNILEKHHRDRINVMLGKSGNDWNVNQSKIAIGSGGWDGKGFLSGTQTKYDFVPELSTDFIFCTIGEEHGFIGSFIVLALLFGLLSRILFISERQRSKFSRIYGYGVASILFFHITINIAMTIGLAPVIGIPLPFFSYGGSSLLSFTILLFILLKLDGDRLAVLR